MAEQLDDIHEILKELRKQQKDLCDYVMETSHGQIQKVDSTSKLENWFSNYIDDPKYAFALKWIKYFFTLVIWFYGCLGLVPLLGPYLQILFIANVICTAYVYTPKLIQEMILTPLLRCLWTVLLMIFSPLITCLYSSIMSTHMFGISNMIKGFLIDTIGDAYTMFSKGLFDASESPFFKEYLVGGMASMWDHVQNVKTFFNPWDS